MDTRNRTTSLDVAKCLAAFLVVAIHADFPGILQLPQLPFHGLALCLARMPDSKKWGLASLQNQCRLRKQKHGRCYRAAILFLYLYVPSPCHKPVLKHSMAVPKQTLRFYPAHRGLHSHDSLHNTNPGPLLRNPKNKAAPHFLKPPCFLLKNC